MIYELVTKLFMKMQLHLYGIVAMQCRGEERRGEGVSCTYVVTAVTRTWVVRFMYGFATTEVRCKHKLFLNV